MSRLYDTLHRELHRIAHERMYRLLLAVLPVVSFSFFALLFGAGVARNIPVAVVDEDQSALSRKVVTMIGETPTALVRYELQSMREAEAMVRRGEITGVVLIPAHFEKNILAMRPTSVESYISGANVTVNGLLSKDIQTAVQTYTAGVQLQVLQKQGLTERQAMAQLMPVRFDRHVLFNPYLNYSYYLSPAFMPMMLMIFVMMATLYAIGSELRNSTAAEWLATAGGSLTRALAGKLLPITVTMAFVGLAMLTIMLKVVGVPLNGSIAIVLVGTVLFIAAYQAIAILIAALLANLRLSLSIGGGYSVLAFTFSGLTFPIMAMWEPMQWVSRLFPFTFYTNLVVDQLLRGAPVHCSLRDLAALALFTVVPMLALPRLKQVCSEERFWGKR